MNITVTQIRSTDDITVQSRYDGEIEFCNHAGAKEDTVTREAFINGHDVEYEEYAILCDKCDAAFDRDGGEL